MAFGKQILIPPKTNGWNLEMMVSNRNLLFPFGPFSGSMFVLGGVDLLKVVGKMQNIPQMVVQLGNITHPNDGRANR